MFSNSVIVVVLISFLRQSNAFVSISPICEANVRPYNNVSLPIDQVLLYDYASCSIEYLDPPEGQTSLSVQWTGMQYSNNDLTLFDQANLLLYFQSSTFSIGNYSVTNLQGVQSQCSYSVTPTGFCSAISASPCAYFHAIQVLYCPSTPAPSTTPPLPPPPFHPYIRPIPWYGWFLMSGLPAFFFSMILGIIGTIIGRKLLMKRRADYVAVN